MMTSSEGAPFQLCRGPPQPRTSQNLPNSTTAHGISNRDTHLYLPHNNSSVHLKTTTEVRRSGRIADGIRSGWRTLRDSVLSFRTSAPTLLEWPWTVVQTKHERDCNCVRITTVPEQAKDFWHFLFCVLNNYQSQPCHSMTLYARVLRGLKFLSVPASQTSNPPPSRTPSQFQPVSAPTRTISDPNLHLSLCVWKSLKAHATCFIADRNLFSGSFQSQQKLLKNIVNQNVKPFNQARMLLS